MTPTQRRLAAFGGILGIWTLIALAFATSTYAMYAVKGAPVKWSTPLYWSFSEWYVWAALSPFIVLVARRFPLSRASWPAHLVVHLVAFTVFHFAHEAGYVALERAGGFSSGELTFAQTVWLYAIKRAAFNLLVYAAVVAVAHAADLYRRYRERELRASQLETKLARAQLEVLKIQLQPHFLFNTLNTISALLHRNPDAADRVVTRLGDLLRLSLQNAGRQEVSLRQELEFLERYLDIQQTRFRDRLTVRLDTDPEALDALVPSLVLQPLVENAIRYGIEPRAAPGHIEVVARRENGSLRLEVSDDGPGLDGSGRVSGGNGIGLANTRARLAQLYGKDHRFVLRNGAGGGVVVTLEIPFRTGNLPTPIQGLHA